MNKLLQFLANEMDIWPLPYAFCSPALNLNENWLKLQPKNDYSSQ